MEARGKLVKKSEYATPARVTPTGLFFSAFWVGGHDHAARHTLGPHRHLWAIVEAAQHLAFRTRL
jgi:hypothetical protein